MKIPLPIIEPTTKEIPLRSPIWKESLDVDGLIDEYITTITNLTVLVYYVFRFRASRALSRPNANRDRQRLNDRPWRP